jgi:hypothetical protein
MEQVFENQLLVITADNNAFVFFKNISVEEISNNFKSDAEIAVQEWLDSEEGQKSVYANATAGTSSLYISEDEKEYGITVQLTYN